MQFLCLFVAFRVLMFHDFFFSKTFRTLYRNSSVNDEDGSTGRKFSRLLNLVAFSRDG
jgi:hypothetical protein